MNVEIRKFLNRKGYQAIAAVYATFSNGYGSLYISDCSRQVTLSIDASGRGERANTLYKIDTLVSVLNELRDAVEEYKP